MLRTVLSKHIGFSDGLHCACAEQYRNAENPNIADHRAEIHFISHMQFNLSS
jgi:hypothetical protein